MVHALMLFDYCGRISWPLEHTKVDRSEHLIVELGRM